MVNLKRIGAGRTAEIFQTDDGRALKLFYDLMPQDKIDYKYDLTKKVAEVCVVCAGCI
jgi:hypothetical protein